MAFYQLIENRRSIRSYDKNRDVPQDTLQQILNAGRLAPTAANRQPARFILIKKRYPEGHRSMLPKRMVRRCPDRPDRAGQTGRRLDTATRWFQLPGNRLRHYHGSHDPRR